MSESVSVRVCVCVCVCVREREREREGVCVCVCVWSRMEAVAVRDGEATVTSTHGRAKHCTQAARERGRCGRKGRRAATSCKRKWKGG